MICKNNPAGHMHLKGCYDFFRPPRTKYELWQAQHEKKKRRREEEEARLADQEMVALSKMCSLALYSYHQQYHRTLALTHSNLKQHVNETCTPTNTIFLLASVSI